ncbi:hypothetical protein D9M73_171830 [compost metagenome]
MVIEKCQVECSSGQALDQVLLFTVAQANVHTRVALTKTGDQARQVEWRHGFETANVDLPGDGIVVGQGILFELMGHLQQRLGLGVEAFAAGRQ